MNTSTGQSQESVPGADHNRPEEQDPVSQHIPAPNRWCLDRRLSLFDGILAFTAIVGMVFLGFQSCQLKRSTDMTKQSIDLSRQQFELAERPWLSATTSAVEPLTFDDATGIGSIGIKTVLTNTGRSTAVNVRVADYLIGDLIAPLNVVVIQERLCAQLQTDDMLGYTVFPGTSEEIVTRVLMPRDEVQAASKRLEAAAGSEAVAERWRGRIIPSLVTCIKYRSSLSAWSEYHQTRYLFTIGDATEDLSQVGAIVYPRGVVGSRLWPVFFGRYAD